MGYGNNFSGLHLSYEVIVLPGSTPRCILTLGGSLRYYLLLIGLLVALLSGSHVWALQPVHSESSFQEMVNSVGQGKAVVIQARPQAAGRNIHGKRRSGRVSTMGLPSANRLLSPHKAAAARRGLVPASAPPSLKSASHNPNDTRGVRYFLAATL